MKRALALLLFFANSSWALEPGDTAPDFSLPTRGGKTVTLSEHRGSYIYLDFFASWCVPCRDSLPWMERIQKQYPALKVLPINLDKRSADLERFLEKTPVTLELLLDPEGKTPTLFQPKGMPTSYVIDPNGRVLSVHLGFKPSVQTALEEELQRLLGGSP